MPLHLTKLLFGLLLLKDCFSIEYYNYYQIHFTAYNKKEDSPENLECSPEEVKAIADFKREIVYPVVLKAEEETKIFTQWLTAGRTYNALMSKDTNFMSHWCNDDMDYNLDGTIECKDPKFLKEEKPPKDEEE